MAGQRIVILGGGAAGFFAAITCAQTAPGGADVSLLERGAEFLQKVRISGGGRCNVTNVISEPRELSRHYPRGERALLPAFHRFTSSDTVEWFERRGVPLKAEEDGRMFPRSDNSGSVVNCLLTEAQAVGVHLQTQVKIESVEHRGDGFLLRREKGEPIECDRLLLATGGCRSLAAGDLAASLGHTIVPPVPSLFSFHARDRWLQELPGVAVADVEATVAGTKLRQRGPLLITHQGFSGPAILRLSAWGARILHDLNYDFVLRLSWLPSLRAEQVTEQLRAFRSAHPARLVSNSVFTELPVRLWELLVSRAGIEAKTQWSHLTREQTRSLTQLLTASEIAISGKSLNKDEFVTCGGVRLNEVDFRTMQSRKTAGLFFAGEILDLDGITGGFNFQSAWTTGWIAGKAMAL